MAGPATTLTRQRNRRGEGSRLREDLVTAATAMVAESGDADSLTLRGLARRVGITAPSVYQHFTDLDELKTAVAERTFQTFAEVRDIAGRGVTDPAAALLARCQAYCTFALDHPGPYRFLFRPRAALAQTQTLPGGPALTALADSIDRCQSAAVAAATDDPLRLATQLWAALHGLVLLRMNLPDFPWPASLPDMVEQTVIRLVDLTAPDPTVTNPSSGSTP